jgi:hypothetical protein
VDLDDPRHGTAATLDEARALIDEQIEEDAKLADLKYDRDRDARHEDFFEE